MVGLTEHIVLAIGFAFTIDLKIKVTRPIVIHTGGGHLYRPTTRSRRRVYLRSSRKLRNGVRYQVATVRRRFAGTQQNILMAVSDFRANLADGVRHVSTPTNQANDDRWTWWRWRCKSLRCSKGVNCASRRCSTHTSENGHQNASEPADGSALARKRNDQWRIKFTFCWYSRVIWLITNMIKTV